MILEVRHDAPCCTDTGFLLTVLTEVPAKLLDMLTCPRLLPIS